jgi:glucose-1-phosphate thymidylyltransferase
MLAHALDQVLPVSPEKIIFITGFLGDQIETWARESLDVPVAFVTQPEMRGQTDAILRTRGLVERDALILFPDMLFEADFSDLADVDADVVMFTKEVEDPSALGIAVVEQGRIVRLVEKPQEPISNLAVIGIYYMRNMEDLYTAIEEQMRRGLALKNEYYIADAIQLMIDAGANVISRPVTNWEDCGSADALLSSNRSLLERHSPPVGHRDGSVIVAPSFVADDATIVNSVIGPYASIGRGVTVRGSIVRDSIIEAGAEICGATLEQSIVGRRASVHGFRGQLNVGDDAVVGL